MVKKSYKDRIGKVIPYIELLTPQLPVLAMVIRHYFLWYAIHKMGVEGIKERALASIEMAKYTEEKLRELA